MKKELTPNEIKEELIRRGWVDSPNTNDVGIILSNKELKLIYDYEFPALFVGTKGFLSDELDDYDFIVVNNPTLDRIEALVFGLTNEKI